MSTKRKLQMHKNVQLLPFLVLLSSGCHTVIKEERILSNNLIKFVFDKNIKWKQALKEYENFSDLSCLLIQWMFSDYQCF